MTDTCVNCDTPLIEGHRFCRVCGRRAEPAQRAPPPPDPVGEGCPSCGRAATANERFCRTCGTALTADAGRARPSRALPTPEPLPTPPAPRVAPRRPPAAQTQRIAPAPAPAYGAAAQDRSSRGRGKTVRIVLLALLGVLVLAGGVFAGLTFLASDAKRSPTGGASTDAGGEDVEKRASVLPSISRTEMSDQIRQTFATYYQNIIDGDLDAAFNLLSERKQNAALREDGIDAWKEAQAALSSFLDPSELKVTLEYADPTTGVARVRLDGMTYSNPSSPCSTWAGITWVKYEQGGFRYDPGYSTTPQRARDWKHRYSELLGTGC